MPIVNRIRKLRFERDEMTQAELAQSVDVSRQTINAIERNQRPPTLEVAYRIAECLGEELDGVFHYEPDAPQPVVEDGDLIIWVSIDDGSEADRWWESDR